jgi:hypothetical protein
MNGEEYFVDEAFVGHVPWNDEEHFNYVCHMEQVFHVTVGTPCKQK